jgi:hypothetical protein
VTDTPTATDNCAGALTATTGDSLTYNTQGTNTIHWTFDDGNGNTIGQTQRVIVADTTAPVPDLVSLPDVVAQCSVSVTNVPAATDNCSGTVTGTTEDTLTYSEQGTNTIHWVFSDGHGNTSSQNQRVIVRDTIAPVAEVDELSVVTGQCSATVTAPTATDNCDGAITATTEDPTTYNAQGTNVVHWVYTDSKGNTSTQNQTVIVADTIAPVPDAESLPDVIAQCAVTVTNVPTATDACVGAINGTTEDPLTYSEQGTNTIHWVFADGRGNSVEQTQRVIIQDTVAPVPDVETLPVIGGGIPLVLTAPTATDACVGTVVATTEDPTTYDTIGTNTVHWVYDDGHGNTTEQTQTVIIDGALPHTQDALNQINNLLDGNHSASDQKLLNQILTLLDKVTNEDSWSDVDHPDSSQRTRKLFKLQNHATKKLASALNNPNSTIDDATVADALADLVTTCRIVTETAIEEATDASGNAGLIAKANALLAQGDAAADAGKGTKAIRLYKSAWLLANKAKPPVS